MEEIRWYLILFLLCGHHHSAESALSRESWGTQAQTVDAFFSVSSVMTTTGYATADFNLWPSYSRTILVMLMFIGACAGSTCGGIK